MRVVFCNKFSTKILVSSKSVQNDLKKININAYKNSKLIKHSVEIIDFKEIKLINFLKKNIILIKVFFFFQITIGYIKII